MDREWKNHHLEEGFAVATVSIEVSDEKWIWILYDQALKMYSLTDFIHLGKKKYTMYEQWTSASFKLYHNAQLQLTFWVSRAWTTWLATWNK